MNLSLPFDDLALQANAQLLRQGGLASAPVPVPVPSPGLNRSCGPGSFERAAPDGLAPDAPAVDAPAIMVQSGPAITAAPAAVHRAPENLHPALWRADQLGGGLQPATPSGFAALDAELPGGGWPHRMLTELLLPHAGVGELRLLAPALALLAGRSARGVMFFNPPAGLHAPALAALGLSTAAWLVVRGRGPASPPLKRLLPEADVLWALEQALKSGHVGAVLAWLPAPLKADALRRLQLAAQAHDGPAFLFREAEARHRPSPAPLRLLLQPAGPDALKLQLLKRRGPPLAQALRLQLAPALSPQPEVRTLQRQRAEAACDWRARLAPAAAARRRQRLAARAAMAALEAAAAATGVAG